MGITMFDFLSQFGTSTLTFVVTISILVFIHEFGHYWVALKNGVKVETFSIGFGPELYHWLDKKGTRWRIAAIPLGGYVKMFGDQDPASMTSDTTTEAAAAMTEADRNQAFFAKTVWQRMAIVAAGPGINFLFCIIALFGLYITIGQPYSPAVVKDVIEGKPAAVAGLQSGDQIITLNGQKIESFQQIQKALSVNLGAPVDIIVRRDGAETTYQITPQVEEVKNNFGAVHRVGRLGIIGGGVIEYVPQGVVQAAGNSFKDTWMITVGTLTGLWQIIVGERSTREMGGVISIAKMSGEMVVKDHQTQDVEFGKTIAALVWFMALLSANLGLINLFPIPVLDGGHLVFYSLEAIRGRPLGDKAQEYCLRFGLAFILSLTIFALWNDLLNLGVVDKVISLFT